MSKINRARGVRTDAVWIAQMLTQYGEWLTLTDVIRRTRNAAKNAYVARSYDQTRARREMKEKLADGTLRFIRVPLVTPLHNHIPEFLK